MFHLWAHASQVRDYYAFHSGGCPGDALSTTERKDVPRGCLQTQAIQTRMAASRVTAKNRQARFSYLVAKRGAVQHQSAPIHNVLGNQFLKNMLPNTLQAPPAKPAVHTFPRAIPFRQVPPRYSCIQPIQDSIEHYPIVFSGSSAMRRLFWRQLLFYFIPLFFCQFMSLHTSILLLLP